MAKRGEIASLGLGEPMTEARCSTCGREMPGERANWPQFPFCSARCRQIDLGRWLGEVYRIPKSTPEEEAEPDSDSDSSS